jgi:hypothetical protein
VIDESVAVPRGAGILAVRVGAGAEAELLPNVDRQAAEAVDDADAVDRRERRLARRWPRRNRSTG